MTEIGKIITGVAQGEARAIGRAISMVENHAASAPALVEALDGQRIAACLVLGITGPPGAGKSTLTARLIQEYRRRGRRIGIVAVDPSSPLSGGALLGDRVRMMTHTLDPDVVIRSMASRGRLGGVCGAAGAAVRIMAHSGCTVVLIETVGVGQSEMDVVGIADLTAMVLAPGLGDDIQAMKAGLLEVADLLVVNKADLRGADRLILDMESVALQRQDKQGRAVPVCATVADQGQGVAALVDHFHRLHREIEASGAKERHRRRARRAEVADWAMELLRPRIIEAVAARSTLDGDALVLARQILTEMGLAPRK
ncbi:MAG: methylmalonyl Co-A mutase-associated GTPase MeaB [Desulfobulbaceae bacterium]|nr:MAG: methylmalonyl Co-A mutase-associated GTPase MeaB [Desulfobulbaceae bacterium]